jgi:hypothetical protein
MATESKATESNMAAHGARATVSTVDVDGHPLAVAIGGVTVPVGGSTRGGPVVVCCAGAPVKAGWTLSTPVGQVVDVTVWDAPAADVPVKVCGAPRDGGGAEPRG